VGAVDDLLPVGRPPGPAVVTELAGELPDTRAIDVHDVDVQIAILERREDDLPAIRREHSFRGVDAVAREPAQSGAIGARGVDVERIEPPHIPLRRVRTRRTDLLEGFARGEEDASVAVHEIAAGCLALTARDPSDLSPV